MAALPWRHSAMSAGRGGGEATRKMSPQGVMDPDFGRTSGDESEEEDERFASCRSSSFDPELSFEADDFGEDDDSFEPSSTFSLASSFRNSNEANLVRSPRPPPGNGRKLAARTATNLRNTIRSKKALVDNTKTNRSAVDVKTHLLRMASLPTPSVRTPPQPKRKGRSVNFFPKALIHEIDTETMELKCAFWEPVDESAKEKLTEPKPLQLNVHGRGAS